jgi:hypothetical protein
LTDIERAVVAGIDLARTGARRSSCGSHSSSDGFASRRAVPRGAHARGCHRETRMPEGDATADVRDVRAFLEPSSTAEAAAS